MQRTEPRTTFRMAFRWIQTHVNETGRKKAEKEIFPLLMIISSMVSNAITSACLHYKKKYSKSYVKTL